MFAEVDLRHSFFVAKFSQLGNAAELVLDAAFALLKTKHPSNCSLWNSHVASGKQVSGLAHLRLKLLLNSVEAALPDYLYCMLATGAIWSLKAPTVV